MKRNWTIFLEFIVLGIALVLWPIMGNRASGADEAKRVGVHIHGSIVDGYGFEYYLLNLPGKETQHMMVYIQDPEGNNIRDAKVGFLIIGPDGTKQKTMAMGLKGAFGADVDFGKKGAYTVKVKAVIGDKKLFDRFKYEVK